MTALRSELTETILTRLAEARDLQGVQIGWANQCAQELMTLRMDWDEEINALQDCINDAMLMISPGAVEIPFPEDFIIALKSFVQEHHAYFDMIEILEKKLGSI